VHVSSLRAVSLFLLSPSLSGMLLATFPPIVTLVPTLFEPCLTVHTPFDGDTPVAVAMHHIQDIPIPPSQFNPNIPPPLEEIILRCLEKSPEMRYRDGSQLAQALEML
jgi:serine/threonine protein kinase